MIAGAEAIAVIDVATGDASTPGWVPCFIDVTFPGKMPPPSGPDLGASLAFDRFPFNQSLLSLVLPFVVSVISVAVDFLTFGRRFSSTFPPFTNTKHTKRKSEE